MKSIQELINEQSMNDIPKTEEILQTEEIVANVQDESTPDIDVSAQEVEGYSSSQVIELLKQSLNIHWQQTTLLTAQAIHLERWGYKKIAAILKADAEEEHKHAAINIERLEFFDIDYQPLTVSPPVWTRHDMVAMIKYNLDSVREAAASERATITAARSVGDEMTANVMIPLLQGSEDGIRLYEGYLKLIEQMGIDNFLTLQV
jgi:bacterioferritin (cytochrome b1)